MQTFLPEWRCASSRLDPRNLPNRSFMKRFRQPDKILADEKEEEPGHENPCNVLQQPCGARESSTFSGARSNKFLQAGGTNDSIVVLGNAFAAEELEALRTPSRRLANRMVETSLIGEITHGSAGEIQRPFKHFVHASSRFLGRELALRFHDQRTNIRNDFFCALYSIERRQFFDVNGSAKVNPATRTKKVIYRQND